MYTSCEYIQYREVYEIQGDLRWNSDCLYQEDKTRYPQVHTNAAWFIDYDEKSQARTKDSVGLQNTQIARMPLVVPHFLRKLLYFYMDFSLLVLPQIIFSSLNS